MQEGYSTCLVNVLLEITRLPGTTFLVFPPSCVTSNLDDLNYPISSHLNVAIGRVFWSSVYLLQFISFVRRLL